MKSRFSLSKAVRLRTRREYQRMAYYDSRHVGRYLIFDVKSNRHTYPRLGITVTRRYGKSHLRNRIKRQIREVFRLCQHSLQPGLDIHVKPRSAASLATLVDIKAEFLRYLSQQSGE